MLVEDYYYSIDCNFVQMFSLFAQQIVMQDHANMVMQGTLFPLRLILYLIELWSMSVTVFYWLN